MEARDIMAKDVIAVTPDMLIGEAADLLMRYRIHGAPVVDDGGQLIGMISFMDLAGRPGEKVRDVMTPDPVSAPEDTPAEELVTLMLEQMVRRFPIVRGGRVICIVSAGDIIQEAFLNLHRSQHVRTEVQEREIVRGKGGRR